MELKDLREAAVALLDEFRAAGLMIATAESCTGGLIAACLTDIANSSDVFERGFVTYSNAAKTESLGVPADLVEMHGAVSAEVACAMADGTLVHSRADIAVSVTGIAGPGGGSTEKPVGLVYIGCARRGSAATAERHLFSGDRTRVRYQAALAALAAALTRAES